jgi:lipid-binding SYLF domain-containing protein
MAIAHHIVVAALFAIATDGTRVSCGYVENYRQRMVIEATDQASRAARTVDAIMQTRDRAILRALLARAKAVAVFSRAIERATELEGDGAPGVVSRHVARGWASPVFLRGVGSKAVAPFGAASTDYVLLFMTERSVAGLMSERFEAGGDVVLYSWSNGVLSGVNVKGVVLWPEDQLNMAVYIDTAREMLSGRLDETIRVSGGLNSFPQALGRHATTSRKGR